MRSRAILALLLLTLFLLTSLMPLADADEIVLTGGTRIEGTVLVDTKEELRLLLPLGDELLLKRADVAEVALDASAPQPGEYFRYHAEGAGGEGLDVAVTHLVSPDGGPRVDLVGVIHVADPAYYRAIQRLLDREALVIYEAIKPAEQTNQEFEEDRSESPVRTIQESLARWFDLEFQLDGIDYDRTHFVHGDMSAEEFQRAFSGENSDESEANAGEESGGEAEGGEEKLPPQLGQMLKQFEAMLPALDQMFSKPGPMRDNAKKMIARLLASGSAEKMLGTAMPGLSEVIIDQRNRVVVGKVGEQLGETEGPIAVFYGAAHMRGIEEGIIETLGYRRAGARWIRAWDLGKK